jgi:energy-converting hydrogenase Eha subunit A
MNKLLKQTQKLINDSLGFLDNTWVRVLLMVLVVLYVVGGVPLLTMDVARIFHNPLVKLGAVLLILYVGVKDIPLALLLALAFVLSLQMGYRYHVGAQLGAAASGLKAAAEAGVDGKEIAVQAKLGDVEGMMSGDDDEKPEGYNYNEYTDCVKDCAENDLGVGALDSPCKGVGVWKDELNAQGLNCPLGYSGEKEGAPF